MGTLSVNMIITRTKVADIAKVRNLNIWGSDLEFVFNHSPNPVMCLSCGKCRK